MKRLQIIATAERDLEDGFRFYERQTPGIGSYFLDSLFADLDSLIAFAGIHAKSNGNARRMLARRFPFAIYYVLESDLVTVVAVLDCRRDPASIDARLGALRVAGRG